MGDVSIHLTFQGTLLIMASLSIYHISPLSGQIYRHVVDSIRPAPHSSIYATLGAAFGKFAGFRPTEPEPAVPGVRTCPVDTRTTGKPVS